MDAPWENVKYAATQVGGLPMLESVEILLTEAQYHELAEQGQVVFTDGYTGVEATVRIF